MLAALMRKEWQCLRRDLHALGALFVMPAVFIVVMSLALSNLYSPPLATFTYAIDARDRSVAAMQLIRTWADTYGSAQELPADPAKALQRGALAYVLQIDSGFGAAIESLAAPATPVIHLRAEPALERNLVQMLHARLAAMLGEMRARALLSGMASELPTEIASIAPFVDVAQNDAERLSAVQYNVPAWLVFGMFFVVIAIAGLFVQEQRDGTLARLHASGVPPRIQVLSKALPYVVVNLLQAAAMLAVGVFAMPLLGADGLSLDGVDPFALVLVLAATSMAAIGFALMIACLSRSHAQANTFGPFCNIVMAALGGIMVPTFAMPPAMQTLAAASPMNWGLEGLNAVLLRHGSFAEAAPWALRLALFGGATLALASALFARRIHA
ncbi:MAG: ABC transporter permease [Burkholderiaceae bacterium]